MNSTRVVVVGGTGFLGQHICERLHASQYNVTAIGLSVPAMSPQVHQEQIDIDAVSDDTLQTVFRGHEALVYALGPDDRTPIPKGMSAFEFYQDRLVNRTDRVARIARKAGVRRMIVLGSYFAYFDRVGAGTLLPYSLAQFHPYIQARVQQEMVMLAMPDIEAVTIEIPYVLGATTGMASAMKMVFSMYARSPWIIFGRGGTTVISVDGVARAVEAALTYARPNDRLAVGSQNMSFKDLFNRLLAASGSRKKFWAPPTWLLTMLLRFRSWGEQLRNRDSGLNYEYLATDILKQNFFVDYERSNTQLHIDTPDDMDAAIWANAKELRESNVS